MEATSIFIVCLEELDKIGAKLLPSGEIETKEFIYSQSNVISSDPMHIYNLARKYENFGINCLIVEYEGVLTLWRGVKVNKKKEEVEKKPIVVHIDDSPTEGAKIRTLLAKFNCDTVVITKVIEAVPTVLRIRPNLVLLDICMPLINGYEICAQLRRAVILKGMPIVMVTSSGGIVDRARAQIVGATDFLTKPVKEDNLLRIISKYVYGVA